MLEKLIEYLKNLSKEEQEKLMQALQVEDDPVENDPVENDPVENDPVENDPVENDPVEDDPVEDDPAENDPVENDPVENDPVENDPVENDPVEDDPVEDDPAENDPVEELLETKIELALIKLGIREDRLEAAKRLFKTEIQSIEDLDKLKELVKEFPEWQKQKREQGAGFGANLKENGNSLSEEEKKLKSMGIDPKN